ncbi:MAG: serine acetyltransferase [Lentisphaerae bacterium]|jgi:serine O-acetyltransferase|nr:serine acetyltransferase [Lentisphaerota bacterium]MBT4821382.1 serine acetyltransferase [Lentisphaerota bacterium]MBT5610338.1 serine acetyltransferase [Lentisphaerota bacterium]MBT7056166.1 serine acetyltransferase [Lentisphaerota bacterium]MBT7841912.1 serine acetyltransferase [Lentisphaerota bacterium]
MTGKAGTTIARCSSNDRQPFPSQFTPELARELTASICETYEDERGINHLDGSNMPEREEILGILNDILEILFPGYSGRHRISRAGLEFSIGNLMNEAIKRLVEQVERALAYRCRLESCDSCDCRKQAGNAAIALFRALPSVREVLKTDVQAAMEGDPAAKSTDEVVISYPGLKAIAVHRVAHELHRAGVPLIPRVMGEHAHATTGIDIHPGATIGHRFFIDHGTGVVIGETATIGDRVKLYQGVTLGAMSFPKDACGRLIKGVKRHPNLEDGVTVYAGATLLGDITVGHHSVIGGNVWLTESVPPHTKITIAPPELAIRTRGNEAGSANE